MITVKRLIEKLEGFNKDVHLEIGVSGGYAILRSMSGINRAVHVFEEIK